MTTPLHGILAGRYELREQIGRGGMGAVWLGQDTVLDRAVAIKQIGLAPGGGAPDLVRAEREAHLAARVNHENVVAVYDLVLEGHHQWLVMEHVDGPSLADRIAAEGPIGTHALRPLMAQVAGSLDAAHQHGIVHRDVKPSNILLTADGVAKLSDFGIARAEADAALTRTGLVTGSPAYLAPEVVTGRSASAASDVWSLGATIFHARSGRPAHDSGSNLMDTMHRIVHEDPPRLPSDDPLAELVSVMMQVAPAARPSMATVRDALLSAHPSSLDTVTVSTPTDTSRTLTAPDLPPPSPSTHRAGANAGSRWIWWTAGAAVALLVVVVLLVVGFPRGNDDTSSTASSPTPTTDAPTTDAAPTAAALEGFASDYLTAADSDPEQGFALLTPAYQRESGGLAGYEDFWGDVDGLDIQQVSGDPDNLTVSYTYAYDYEGERRTEDVTLQLEKSGASFLVAGAS